jgi:predicted NBD/HSP70 family sugar kinase
MGHRRAVPHRCVPSAERSTKGVSHSGFPVGDHLRVHFDTNVTVDNDVNLMALGEASHEMGDVPLLFIKVGAGIGAGIVTADGDVLRGADGQRATSATSGSQPGATWCAAAARSIVSKRSRATAPC